MHHTIDVLDAPVYSDFLSARWQFLCVRYFILEQYAIRSVS